MQKNEEEKIQPLDEISLRMHQVRRLSTLRLSRDVLNTEALMLILNKKYKDSNGSRILFKYMDAQEDLELMARKQRVLEYLNSSPYKELDELIIPEYVVNVDNAIAGFAMPLIENHRNLGSILHSDKVSFATKKKYLEQLGALLDKVRKLDSPHKMLFADLNEFNFIIDRDEKMKAIDLDSSYIEGIAGLESPILAYYLLNNVYLRSIPEKYDVKEDGYICPNQNSDFYSYCMIILGTLAGEPMHRKEMDVYYQYLDYLKWIGLDPELVDVFFHIYSPKSNRNPRQLIEGIPDRITRKSNYKVFEKLKSEK
ncbi:MAG: hypothetical protein IKF71_01800 [Bacilli bacterium]|nr:hypothetical protein [Bacilli bacterium]